MMTNDEIYYGLLSIGDEEIVFARQYFENLDIYLPVDGDKAFYWCKNEASNNIPEAQYVLAKLYKAGLFCVEDKKLALYWCNKAVESNFMPALIQLAGFYEMGWGGVNQNPKKAFELIRESANGGYLPAITTLAQLYCSGHLVEENVDIGMLFIRKAAERGEPRAQFYLGESLLDSPIKQESEGLEWLNKSAKQKFPDAHSLLGYFYMTGSHEIPKDKNRARYHFDLAEQIRTANSRR